MGDFLCKIWRFLSNLVEGVLNFIFDLIRKIGDLAIGLVSDLVDAVIGGGLGGWLALALAGVVVYYVVTKDKDDDKTITYDQKRY